MFKQFNHFARFNRYALFKPLRAARVIHVLLRKLIAIGAPTAVIPHCSETEERFGYGNWPVRTEVRLKDMDRLGWDIQVILPTGNNGNFAYRVALKDLELGAAMCRAYNNWAHEYCTVDPKRLKFVAILPGSDVGEMVKEARRAVQELGDIHAGCGLLVDSGSVGFDPGNQGTQRG